MSENIDGTCGTCGAYCNGQCSQPHRNRHMLRIGGVMRCCIATLDERVARDREPQEGEKLPCNWCSSGLIYRDGAWEWDHE